MENNLKGLLYHVYYTMYKIIIDIPFLRPNNKWSVI